MNTGRGWPNTSSEPTDLQSAGYPVQNSRARGYRSYVLSKVRELGACVRRWKNNICVLARVATWLMKEELPQAIKILTKVPRRSLDIECWRLPFAEVRNSSEVAGLRRVYVRKCLRTRRIRCRTLAELMADARFSNAVTAGTEG